MARPADAAAPGTDRAPIVVIGGANVDRKARSLAPLMPGSSNPVTMTRSFGGVARNVAEALARLGLPVRLLAATGADADGTALRTHLRGLGVDTRALLRLSDVPTGSYTALLQPNGQMLLAASDMAATERLDAVLLRRRGRAWRGARWRVADLNLPRAGVDLLLADSLACGATLVAVAVSEPKMDRLPERLGGLALLILNIGELAARAGRDLPDRRALAAACRELQRQGAGEVVVTLGAEGVLHTCGQAAPGVLRAPRPAAVVDVTGAGDAFAAGVVASLVRHRAGLARACRFGLRLAALTLATLDNVAPALGPALLEETVDA